MEMIPNIDQELLQGPAFRTRLGVAITQERLGSKRVGRLLVMTDMALCGGECSDHVSGHPTLPAALGRPLPAARGWSGWARTPRGLQDPGSREGKDQEGGEIRRKGLLSSQDLV